MTRYHFSSLTRIAPLATRPFEVRRLPREQWQTGDYVVGELISTVHASLLELSDGRNAEVVPGDLVVGALGNRRATLDIVGDWQAIGDDGVMDSLNMAGVFGRATSRSVFSSTGMQFSYQGHVHLDGQIARMRDWAGEPRSQSFDLPVVQVIGTSMECGKTTAARAVIRRLARRGVRVAGIKLTGVGRYRDVLSMRDAGAALVLDFVDTGLPSSLEEPDAFAASVRRILRLVADHDIDVVVAEAGASPMEPYNGDMAMECVKQYVKATLLAATDLYAAMGAIDHLGIRPDLIVGRVASTSAGISIVREVTGVQSLNPLDAGAAEGLDALLTEAGLL